MGVVFYKVYWTSASAGVEVDISEITNGSLLRALEAKSTTATLSFKNSYYPNRIMRKYVLTNNRLFAIKNDDTIMIYVDHEPITRAANQLLINGFVKEVSQTFEEGGVKMEVTVVDKTYILLSKIPAKRYWDGRTPPQIVRHIVEQVATGEISIGGIDTVHPKGGAFNPISFAGSIENAYELIRTVSQPEYCQTLPGAGGIAEPQFSPRNFIFWVDAQNMFHWKYPDDVADYTESDEELSIYSEEFSHDSFDVVNMYIFDCGVFPNPSGKDYHIYWYLFNEANAGGELRMKFMPMTDITDGPNGMRNQEKARMAGLGNLDADDDGYPDAYPYLTNWRDSNGDTITVNSNSEYYSAFRDEAIIRGETRARGFFKSVGEVKLAGSIELKGTNAYGVGEVINFTAPAYGIQNQLLRVKEVNHSITKTGWFTTIALNQDESLITA